MPPLKKWDHAPNASSIFNAVRLGILAPAPVCKFQLQTVLVIGIHLYALVHINLPGQSRLRHQCAQQTQWFRFRSPVKINPFYFFFFRIFPFHLHPTVLPVGKKIQNRHFDRWQILGFEQIRRMSCIFFSLPVCHDIEKLHSRKRGCRIFESKSCRILKMARFRQRKISYHTPFSRIRLMI